MNKPLLETLKQTRDALDLRCGSNAEERKTLIPNLDTAIEQLESAEPAGMVICCEYTATLGKFKAIVHSDNPLGNGPTYTHPAAPQWQATDHVKCRYCGQDTMHLGDICYSCAHPAAPGEKK